MSGARSETRMRACPEAPTSTRSNCPASARCWRASGPARASPVVLLHGIFASSEIWTEIAAELGRPRHRLRPSRVRRLGPPERPRRLGLRRGHRRRDRRARHRPLRAGRPLLRRRGCRPPGRAAGHASDLAGALRARRLRPDRARRGHERPGNPHGGGRRSSAARSRGAGSPSAHPRSPPPGTRPSRWSQPAGARATATFSAPVTAVWGTDDHVVRPHHSRHLSNAFPQADVLFVDGMGHHPVQERREDVLAAASHRPRRRRPASGFPVAAAGASLWPLPRRPAHGSVRMTPSRFRVRVKGIPPMCRPALQETITTCRSSF